jgi:hypothetical protein
MVKIKEVTDNLGNIRKVLTGLTIGQKLMCKQTERSTTGVGLWGSPDDKYDAFEKGKIYKVSHLYMWGSVQVAYVIDEDGCSTWATPETFEVL